MGRTANIIIKDVIHVFASISEIMLILLMGRRNRERWACLFCACHHTHADKLRAYFQVSFTENRGLLRRGNWTLFWTYIYIYPAFKFSLLMKLWGLLFNIAYYLPLNIKSCKNLLRHEIGFRIFSNHSEIWQAALLLCYLPISRVIWAI